MTSVTNGLLEELTRLVGGDHVLTGKTAIAAYCREHRGLFASRPLAVVRPADRDGVAAVVAACAAADANVIPQGGNTGLVGGSSASGERDMVIVSLERLNRVHGVDAANRTITAEAGCTLEAVQQAATDAGCFFPLSYAAQAECQLGGNLATNAGGMNVLRYGNARELAIGLEVVLPDGRIWEGLTGLRKDNSGYDLRDLFIGAEGTLGIITAAVMRLFPQPQAITTAMVGLSSPDQAVALLHRLQAHTGEAISAFELMSRFSVATAIKQGAGSGEPLTRTHPWYVLLDAATTRAHDTLTSQVEQALGAAEDAGEATDWALADAPDARHQWWRIRNHIPAAQREEGASIKHDVSVPVSSVPEFLRRADALVADYMPGIRPCAFGHVGDGNIHYNLSQPEGMDPEQFLAHWQPISERVHDLVVAMGGSFAAEHGIGRLKHRELTRLKSSVETDLMRAIKGALDPDYRMNPGAVLEL